MMRTILLTVFISICPGLVVIVMAQHYQDSLKQELGSKHSLLEVVRVGGSPMFPIYDYYNILEHDADHHRFPMTVRKQSGPNHIFPFAYGTIVRTAEIGGATLEIKNSTGNFTVQEIDANYIQLIFDSGLNLKYLVPFITFDNGANIGLPSASQASVHTVSNVVVLQIYGPGGLAPTHASSYTIHFLGYLPYLP
ncbi:MAG: hypothetical protein KDC53_22325 [Saprospiraceae bacterium]|nr:hypothetical protein [Saprospiraceae bacterium]